MTRQSFNVGITIFKRVVRSMDKDFCLKYQLSSSLKCENVKDEYLEY